MLVLGADKGFWIVFFDVTSLALTPTLPALFLWYARQWFVARQLHPEFLLHESETFELNRAALLHEKISRRLEEIADREQPLTRFWDVPTSRHRDVPEDRTFERQDLEAYARHLRASINDLRRRPLLRLKVWIGVKSAQFALANAIAVHVMSLALLLLLASPIAERHFVSTIVSAWPFDERLLYANAVATAFAAMAALFFYFVRWLSLRRQHDLEFCIFSDLAEGNPYQPIGPVEATNIGQETLQPDIVIKRVEKRDWFKVLGLSQSATIEEIKAAYKALIKQNHPDRVHGMSPIYRQPAERQTQEINAAYRQALVTAAGS